ncbi:MAG: recombinase family protein [Microgenomates group bacterium]
MNNENNTIGEKQGAMTVVELAQEIGEIMNARLEKIDPNSFRYVIYARKSTDEKDNQVESLPAQVEECLEIVKDRDLKLISGKEDERIIQESESAKESGIRPLFSKMLEDIKAGRLTVLYLGTLTG